MGPALNTRSKEIVAGYASIAANDDVDKIHKEKGVMPPLGATIEMCPHASKARAAARMAEELAAAGAKQLRGLSSFTEQAAAAGCPFHMKTATPSSAKTASPAPDCTVPDVDAKTATKLSEFNYERFYTDELEKKHQDNSYRYFNNINRLAAKFPTAHTAKVTDEVEVWCANDYLGMGNNPVVLETMQYVILVSDV